MLNESNNTAVMLSDEEAERQLAVLFGDDGEYNMETLTPGKNLAKNTVLLDVAFHKAGNKKKVNSSAVETDAQKDMLSIRKQLFVCDEYDRITKYLNTVYMRIRARSLPSLFRSGIYMCSLEAVPVIEQELDEARANLAPMVEDLISQLDNVIVDAQWRLGSLFNRTDYPTPEKLRKAFYITHKWFSMDTPDKLEGLDASIFEREKEKAQRALDDAVGELTLLLRDEFTTLVSRLSERLKPEADGKKKIFHDTTITNLSEFADLFDLRNVTDDSDLKRLVENTREILKGVNPKDIRNNDNERKNLLEAFDDVRREIDALPVTTQAPRKISFDDDEV